MPKKKNPVAKPTLALETKLPHKAPIKAEVLLHGTEENGLEFKDAQILFTFRFPNDPYSGGADRQIVGMDEGLRAGLAKFFRDNVDAMIQKHGTCSVEESLKLPKPSAPKAK